jgi:hypothetical protein
MDKDEFFNAHSASMISSYLLYDVDAQPIIMRQKRLIMIVFMVFLLLWRFMVGFSVLFAILGELEF